MEEAMMDVWEGAAAVCVNRSGEVLMVLQGKEDEEKLWSVPAGGRELNETFEECCIREVFEETGYEVEIVRPLTIKKGFTFGIEVEVHYFEIHVTGGKLMIQDPDGLIHEIAWKKLSEMNDSDFAFPEDIDFLKDFIKSSELNPAL
jgi:ADP-ribose pyrophosphatase YjhB (NUDIX family)